MSAPRRILIFRNTDDYPWPWSAGLEEPDGTSYSIIEFGDGDTPDEALADLREQSRIARRVPENKIHR